MKHEPFALNMNSCYKVEKHTPKETSLKAGGEGFIQTIFKAKKVSDSPLKMVKKQNVFFENTYFTINGI